MMTHRTSILRSFLPAVLATALGVCVAGCVSGGGSSDEPRVMVFGIDGGTWDVIVPMIENGELPNLAKLYKEGLHGILEGRPPLISPVVWSTIFTGRDKDDHGVINWKTSQAQHRKVKGLWQIGTEAGLLTHVFNVPSTYPPAEVSGVMLSGFPLGGSTVGGNTGHVIGKDGLNVRTIPTVYKANAETINAQMKGLAIGDWTPWIPVNLPPRANRSGLMRIKRLSAERYYVTPCYRNEDGYVVTHPPTLRKELVDRLGGRPYIPEGPGWSKFEDDETPAYLYEHLAQVGKIQADAATLYAGDPWRLFLYVNTLVDRTSHPYWAYSRAEDYEGLPAEKANLWKNTVADSYRETDKQLGQVLSKVKGDFYLVIASDHGFQSNRDKKKHMGVHKFDGIYMVWGPGIKQAEGARAYIEDITPTVLHLMGMPVAEDMDGKPLPEVVAAFDREVATIPTYEGDAMAGSEMPVDPETWEQLRGLGYVDGPAPKGPSKNK